MIRWKCSAPSSKPEFSTVKRRRLQEIRADLSTVVDQELDMKLPRCLWTHGKNLYGSKGRDYDSAYMAFHDREWGPSQVRDDNRYLMECLAMNMAPTPSEVRENFLNKRDIYRYALRNWDADAVSKITDEDIKSMSELGLSIHRIRALIKNIQRFHEICSMQHDGRFLTYLEKFEGQRGPRDQSNRSVSTKIAELIANDLAREGFKYIREKVVHRFLCMIGFIDDHDWSCWKHQRNRDNHISD